MLEAMIRLGGASSARTFAGQVDGLSLAVAHDELAEGGSEDKCSLVIVNDGKGSCCSRVWQEMAGLAASILLFSRAVQWGVLL